MQITDERVSGLGGGGGGLRKIARGSSVDGFYVLSEIFDRGSVRTAKISEMKDRWSTGFRNMKIEIATTFTRTGNRESAASAARKKKTRGFPFDQPRIKARAILPQMKIQRSPQVD